MAPVATKPQDQSEYTNGSLKAVKKDNSREEASFNPFYSPPADDAGVDDDYEYAKYKVSIYLSESMIPSAL